MNCREAYESRLRLLGEGHPSVEAAAENLRNCQRALTQPEGGGDGGGEGTAAPPAAAGPGVSWFSADSLIPFHHAAPAPAPAAPRGNYELSSVLAMVADGLSSAQPAASVK